MNQVENKYKLLKTNIFIYVYIIIITKYGFRSCQMIYLTDGPDSNKKEYLTREFVKVLYEKLQSVEGTMDLIMFPVGEENWHGQDTINYLEICRDNQR